jgi:hypothetical protein
LGRRTPSRTALGLSFLNLWIPRAPVIGPLSRVASPDGRRLAWWQDGELTGLGASGATVFTQSWGGLRPGDTMIRAMRELVCTQCREEVWAGPGTPRLNYAPSKRLRKAPQATSQQLWTSWPLPPLSQLRIRVCLLRIFQVLEGSAP